MQEGKQQAAKDKQAEVEQQLVQAYVKGIDKTATCRQVVLDRYLDRQEKEQVVCEEGEKKCNVCRGADSNKEDKEETEEEESKEDEGGNSNVEDTDTDTVKAEQEEAQQVFKQQQQAQHSLQQTLIQQQQQEFANVE
ncbi:hypothetical protein N0V95_005470 [Ascochyta clinopodiicola]|nr:hypothetical protein N0V95_005470 [Ascochyta clinopodiicola]